MTVANYNTTNNISLGAEPLPEPIYAYHEYNGSITTNVVITIPGISNIMYGFSAYTNQNEQLSSVYGGNTGISIIGDSCAIVATINGVLTFPNNTTQIRCTHFSSSDLPSSNGSFLVRALEYNFGTTKSVAIEHGFAGNTSIDLYNQTTAGKSALMHNYDTYYNNWIAVTPSAASSLASFAGDGTGPSTTAFPGYGIIYIRKTYARGTSYPTSTEYIDIPWPAHANYCDLAIIGGGGAGGSINASYSPAIGTGGGGGGGVHYTQIAAYSNYQNQVLSNSDPVSWNYNPRNCYFRIWVGKGGDGSANTVANWKGNDTVVELRTNSTNIVLKTWKALGGDGAGNNGTSGGYGNGVQTSNIYATTAVSSGGGAGNIGYMVNSGTNTSYRGGGGGGNSGGGGAGNAGGGSGGNGTYITSLGSAQNNFTLFNSFYYTAQYFWGVYSAFGGGGGGGSWTSAYPGGTASYSGGVGATASATTSAVGSPGGIGGGGGGSGKGNYTTSFVPGGNGGDGLVMIKFWGTTVYTKPPYYNNYQSGWQLSVPGTGDSTIPAPSARFVDTYAGAARSFGLIGTTMSGGIGGMAFDSLGFLYIIDYSAYSIIKVSPSGSYVRWVGTGTAGYTDATGTSAAFGGMQAITVDSNDNVYVFDAGYTGNVYYRIRKITPGRVVTTYAGSATGGSSNGTGTAATFMGCTALVCEGDTMYVADYGNNLIRKIVISTAAVSTLASIYIMSWGLCLGGDGNLYVAGQNCIQQVNKSTGANTVFAGTQGSSAFSDGTGAAARFVSPRYLVADKNNNIYVHDNTYYIRKITIPGAVVSTLTGAADTIADTYGGSGSPTGYIGKYPTPMAASGNTVYLLCEQHNSTSNYYLKSVRKMDTTIYPPSLITIGYHNNTIGSSPFMAPISDPRASSIVMPYGICRDSSGNIFTSQIAGAGYHKIIKIASGGTVSVFAGSGTAGSADGTGAAATFNSPRGLAIDTVGLSSNDIYVADAVNNKIRMITSAGVVTTIAGSGTAGSADNTTGTSATFNFPNGICTDGFSIYVSETLGHVIRKISISSGTWAVTTIAGGVGTAGYVDATGTSARFNAPSSICTDNGLNLYVADTNNHVIRKIVLSTGVVTTIAGRFGVMGYSGDGGPATSATLSAPIGIDVDSSGNIYFGANQRIRKIDTNGNISTIAGGGSVFNSVSGYQNGSGATAGFNTIYHIVLDSKTSPSYLYVSDNNCIRRVIL